MKHVLIMNHTLATSKSADFLKFAETTFQKHHLEYEIFQSDSISSSLDFLASLKTPHRIYICGGDGTLHQSLPALVHTNHEIVLLPFGTGNDFARMLQDGKDPKAHFLHSFHQKAVPIDIMKINDTYCINTACFALDCDVAQHVHDEAWQFLPKQLSYIVALVRRLFVYQCNYVTVTVDQKQWFQGEALLFTINNARFYGGGFCMTPGASITDGRFDLTLIRRFWLGKLVYKIWPLLLHRPQVLKECIQLKHHQIQIHSPQGMNLDGEYYPDTDIKIEILPHALLLVNPIKEVKS